MKNRIEYLKTGALVVLFLTTMLLLYLFWQGPNLDSFSLPDLMGGDEEPVSVLRAQDVTRPLETWVHFGNGIYTAIPEKTFQVSSRMVQWIAAISREENLAVEEITHKQHRQVMDFPSLQLSLTYAIPFASFCEEYQIQRTQNLNAIDFLTAISYSSGSPESIFLYDGKNDTYYRLVSREANDELTDVIAQIEGGGYEPYYTIGDLAGSDNETIIPLSVVSALQDIPYRTEFQEAGDPEIRAFAQLFFSESFDFVRRIEESKGTIIFMYGYGDKILTLHPDGQVEYKEKLVSEGGGQRDYFEALRQVLEFIATHGGFGAEEQWSFEPYIKKVDLLERDRQRGYRFHFELAADGIPVRFQDRESLVVEIFGNQVTLCRRNIFVVDQRDGNQGVNGLKQEALSAINTIAQNHSLIEASLHRQSIELDDIDPEERFEAVTDHVAGMTVGFVAEAKPSDTGDAGRLVPAWILEVEDELLYFDLYDGKILNRGGE